MKNQSEKMDSLQNTVTWAINSPACKIAAGMVALYVVGEAMDLSTGTMLTVGAFGAGLYCGYKVAEKAVEGLALAAVLIGGGTAIAVGVADKGLDRKPRY